VAAGVVALNLSRVAGLGANIRFVFSGLLFFGSFSFAELVRLKPSSVLLEEQKNRSEAEFGEAK
jgi:hypothetical protein